jgi:hypothetical protein
LVDLIGGDDHRPAKPMAQADTAHLGCPWRNMHERYGT